MSEVVLNRAGVPGLIVRRDLGRVQIVTRTLRGYDVVEVAAADYRRAGWRAINTDPVRYARLARQLARLIGASDEALIALHDYAPMNVGDRVAALAIWALTDPDRPKTKRKAKK